MTEININQKNEKLNRNEITAEKAFKAGIWYTIGNFLVKAIVFITMPLFTRLMTVDQVGDFSNLSSWLSIFVILFTFDLFTSVNLAYYEFDNLDGYLKTILIFGTLITSGIYFITSCIDGFIIKVLSIQPYMLHIMFTYLMFYPAMQVLLVKYRIFQDYKRTIAITFASTFFSVLTAIAFVLMFEDKLQGQTIGYYGTLTLFNICVYIFILRKKGALRFSYIKFALAISLPMIVHQLSGTILSISDRIMIQKMIGSEQNAYYTVAYTCSLPVSLLWASMNSAWSPWSYERMSRKEYSALRSNSKPYTILFAFCSCALLLLAPEILYLTGGEAYSQAVYVIPPVVGGYACQFVYAFYVNIEFFHKQQKKIAFATMTAAIANILLNLIFIPLLGYIAAAFTTFIGYLIMYAIHYGFSRRYDADRIYDKKFLLTFLAVFTVFTGLCELLYHFCYLRYMVIALLLIYATVWVIKNKDMIQYAVRNKSIINLLDLKMIWKR